MIWIFLVAVWFFLVAYANLNEYPSTRVNQPNDYGEEHRTS